MNSGDEQAGKARQVLADTFHGVLSTRSLEHADYPVGSVVPYVLDQDDVRCSWSWVSDARFATLSKYRDQSA